MSLADSPRKQTADQPTNEVEVVKEIKLEEQDVESSVKEVEA